MINNLYSFDVPTGRTYIGFVLKDGDVWRGESKKSTINLLHACWKLTDKIKAENEGDYKKEVKEIYHSQLKKDKSKLETITIFPHGSIMHFITDELDILENFR